MKSGGHQDDLYGSVARRAAQAERDTRELARPVPAAPRGAGVLNLRPLAERPTGPRPKETDEVLYRRARRRRRRARSRVGSPSRLGPLPRARS